MVELIAVGATARDKNLGRAEAMRCSMLAIIDTGERRQAHPAQRAPFRSGRWTRSQKQCPLWVKLRRPYREQNTAGIHPKADMAIEVKAWSERSQRWGGRCGAFWAA